jgi:hypothetical protein
MRRIPLLLTLILGAFGSGACGDSERLSSEDTERLCDAQCARAASCGSTQAREACVVTCRDAAEKLLAENVEQSLICEAGLACSASNDTCYQQLRPTAAHESYAKSCSAKMASCFPDETVHFCTLDDDDYPYKLLNTETTEELIACEERACNEYVPCWQSVLDKHGVARMFERPK